jgi:hypothetical protein
MLRFGVLGLILLLVASIVPAMAQQSTGGLRVQVVESVNGQMNPITALDGDIDYISLDGTTFVATNVNLGSLPVAWALIPYGEYTVTVRESGYLDKTEVVNIPEDNMIIVALTPTDGGTTDDGTGGTEQNSTDGDVRIKDIEIPNEVGPGEEFEIEVDVKGYADNLENVVVMVTIVNIDDGDDLEEESDDFSLDNLDKETVNLKFKVPYDVREKKWDVLVRVDWEDEYGQEYFTEDDEKLDVQKEDHKIDITTLLLSRKSVEPGESVELAVEMINLGDDDEEVKFVVESDDLGIDEESATFDLDEGDDTTQYVPFVVSENVRDGNYYVYVTAVYNEGKSSAMQSVILTVKGVSGVATGSQYGGTSVGGVTLSPVTAVSSVSGTGYQPGTIGSPATSDVGLIVSVVALLAVLALVGKEVLPLVKKQLKKK